MERVRTWKGTRVYFTELGWLAVDVPAHKVSVMSTLANPEGFETVYIKMLFSPTAPATVTAVPMTGAPEFIATQAAKLSDAAELARDIQGAAREIGFRKFADGFYAGLTLPGVAGLPSLRALVGYTKMALEDGWSPAEAEKRHEFRQRHERKRKGRG